jgi:predicted nucleic-acid-binding Zn-ribbon protein
MACTVCGGNRFARDEYRMDSGTAPALRCIKCGTLNLDESAAESERGRSSVRLAIAARVIASEPKGQ